MTGSSPFYFLGANAYYLPFIAAYGQTAAVAALFDAARSLGMTVLRTWAFFDSPDTTDAGVIQHSPGVFNETGLRSLDFVVAEAKRASMRLVLPLVNNWDDYGGMNQYVRWKTEARKAGHDDFYTDPVMKGWYRSYVSMLLTRVNTFTGVAYRDEPAIMAWELANEPRSSDSSGWSVCRWLDEMSRFVKSIDQNHLVGSGEEGFDVSPVAYGRSPQEGPAWLFDGSAGVSFARNSALPSLDFASIHLYPEGWSLPVNAGNGWIRDHLRIAGTLGKPLVLGEFSIREGKAQAFESWLTTALLDGAAGSLAWQLLDGKREDSEGYGFVCPGSDPVCRVLRGLARKFNEKSRAGVLPLPSAARLHQNFPNPFHSHTVVTYELPFDANVKLEVFDVTGARVLTVVDDIQRSGVRKEVMDGRALAAGAYFYRITAEEIQGGSDRGFMETRKLIVLH
jgi:mannan endo-1,4-beta-mannosidase